jgi:hypothetical protein
MEYIFLYQQYIFAGGDHRKPHKQIGGRHPSRLRAAYHFVRRLSNHPSVVGREGRRNRPLNDRLDRTKGNKWEQK